MSSDQAEEIQVLYEMATEVGNGYDLKPILSRSLTVILKKLNCSAGTIFLLEEDTPGNYIFLPAKSIPRNYTRNDSLNTVKNLLPEQFKAEFLTDWWAKLPLSGKTQKDCYYHIIDIYPYGLVILIRSGQPLPESFLKKLTPITNKLGAAIFSCLSKTRLSNSLKKQIQAQQDLINYKEHLEQIVQDRTHELLMANTELKEEVKERKRIQEALEKEKKKLQQALSEIKQLSGLLPICASCKKIRDDKGYWNQIESYIQSHSEAVFSHGICPDCSEKLYPDIPIQRGWMIPREKPGEKTEPK